MEKDIYQKILSLLSEAPSIQRYRHIGFCRQWVGEAMRILIEYSKKEEQNLDLSAREVDIGFSLSHTFLRIIAEGQLPFFICGTGVDNYPPFAGYEQDAPAHLQHSRLDVINYYFQGK